MNTADIAGFPAELAEPLEKAATSHELTEDEMKFVARVFARLERRIEESGERARRIIGFVPTTEGLMVVVALIMATIDPSPPMKNELLIGIKNQARPDVILATLRSIVRASFPPETVDHMLDVFS